MNDITPEIAQDSAGPTAEEIAIAHRVASYFAKKRSESMTEEHRRKLAQNARMFGGRQPKKPDGIARAELRKELERVLGQKPLPKEGPVAKLVHIMTSANVLHKTWPAVRDMIPVMQVSLVADKLNDLLVVLGGSKLTIEERTGVEQLQTPPPATTTPNPAPVGAWGGAWGGALKQG